MQKALPTVHDLLEMRSFLGTILNSSLNAFNSQLDGGRGKKGANVLLDIEEFGQNPGGICQARAIAAAVFQSMTAWKQKGVKINRVSACYTRRYNTRVILYTWWILLAFEQVSTRRWLLEECVWEMMVVLEKEETENWGSLRLRRPLYTTTESQSL